MTCYPNDIQEFKVHAQPIDEYFSGNFALIIEQVN